MGFLYPSHYLALELVLILSTVRWYTAENHWQVAVHTSTYLNQLMGLERLTVTFIVAIVKKLRTPNKRYRQLPSHPISALSGPGL